MEVRNGYKRTEVGLIPEDWEVLPIDDLYDFQGGSQPPRHTFIFEEKTGYVRLLQIRDYKTDKYASYIPIPLAKRSCIPTDIMIGRYGPPIFQILNGMEGSYNVALMKAVPSSKIIQKYGWYLLKQDKLFEFVEKLSQRSSGQTGVDLNELRKYLIPLPPTKSEQTAIATALSDADALIASLEKLIEKKRAIKQGAMQELLKPKEGWVVKKLGEVIVEFRGGAPFAPSDFKESGFKVLPKGGVGRGGILSIDNNKQQYCSNEYAANHQTNIVDKKYSIVVLRDLVPSGPSIGLTVKFDTTDRYVLAQGVYGYKVNEDQISSDYLIQLSNTKEYRKIMNNIMVGSTQVHISNSAYLKVSFSFPPTKTEQTRIATILSDMDAEITALEQKLGKYKQIKQGMMQELLTGRIRLI